MVGAERFELPTLCSQSRCATRLRYAPTSSILSQLASSSPAPLPHSSPSRRACPVQHRTAQPDQQQKRHHRQRHQPQPQQSHKQPVLPRIPARRIQTSLHQVIIPPVRPPSNIEQIPQHRHHPHTYLNHQVHHHPCNRHQRYTAKESRQHNHAASRTADKIPHPGHKPNNPIQPKPYIRPRNPEPRIQHPRQ